VKSLLRSLAIFVVILLLLGIIAALLVLTAYGIGWLLRLFLPLSPFEATLLSLVGLIASAVLIWTFIRQTIPYSSLPYYEDEDEEDEEDIVVPIVAPDARCPCGSGRKYKNCHGKI
jgi:membrane protein implicated in regulation of membrane protease activity